MTLLVYQDEGDKSTNIGQWFVYDDTKPDSDIGPFNTKMEADSFRYEKLREQATAIALAGKKAAIARDLAACIELAKRLQPILKELGEIADSDKFRHLADKGQEIINKHTRI